MFRSICVRVLLIALLPLVAPSSSEAQTKPFRVTGAGYVDFVPSQLHDPARHWAIGVATHLGQYYCAGVVQLTAFTSPTTAEFSSAEPCVFVAANGDRLVFHYGRTDFGAAAPGEVELVPAGNGEVIAVWLAEFTPVPAECTGRFKKVMGGSFVMLAITEPFVFGSTEPVAYSWSGEGTLDFKKGKK